ncbi:hypothetical protein DC31_13960 [Microbacterium sp. CH12i]|uniref:peptidoglycan-binding protein n=1 Tax=Microbacterium sp. CH12i TaxID=1479651 RepID=UPI0004618FF4|nr:peptidoglycan-binding protein [Microbacterium sp. CH12i]KDA05567.1 hypothetical protein DC31_13960 [Microbacterium sp. CH12i]
MTKLPIPFGNPMTYPGHSGVDFPQPAGTPFLASGPGVVTWLGSNSRGGYFIWVKYDAIGPKVGYHHMPSHGACPREGQRFSYGDQLGVVGSTGNSTGPHLHSEVEGYATTDGYWQFFDSSRVVGANYPASALYGEAWVKSAQGKLIRLGYDLGQWGADGKDGDATQAATKDLQKRGGLDQDGVYGPATNTYADQLLAQGFPPFPLPAEWYFGPQDGPEESVSGFHGYSAQLRVWQQKMADRGWHIDPDGLYGSETDSIARQFQAEKGLTVDGLIGPSTWDAAWTAEVTPVGESPAGEQEAPAGPKDADNPRGLPTYAPFYPGAFIGLKAPLGDGPRGTGYDDQRKVEVVIDQFHIHRTGTNGDDGEWFSYRNSRSSCPHLHVMADARVREFITPEFKPALTGPDWNWRGYGVEIQGAGNGAEAQFEVVADAMAWLASFEGKTLDGIPVKYNLRQRANTTLTHREMIPGTECPGDWWQDRVDALIVRARVILAEKYARGEPEPTPDSIPVDRSLLQSWFDKLKYLLGGGA